MAPQGSTAPCVDDEATSPQTSADALSTPSPPHSRSSGGSLDAAQAKAAYSRQKLKGKAVMRPGEAGLQSAQLHIFLLMTVAALLHTTEHLCLQK